MAPSARALSASPERFLRVADPAGPFHDVDVCPGPCHGWILLSAERTARIERSPLRTSDRALFSFLRLTFQLA